MWAVRLPALRPWLTLSAAATVAVRAQGGRAKSPPRGKRAAGKGAAKPKAPPRSPSRGKKKPKDPSPSPSPSTTAAPAVSAESRQQREEADVRLTMRVLMSRHFSQRYAMRLPQEARLEEERRRALESQAHRLRRLEEKNRNSQRLLSGDVAAVGDGIVPLFATAALGSSASNSSAAAAAAAGGGGGGGGWRAPNPVGLDDDGDGVSDGDAGVDDAAGITLAALTRPDLSVYSAERDVRVSSEDAVRAGSGGGGGGGAAALLREEMGDADADYSVFMYEHDDTDL